MTQIENKPDLLKGLYVQLPVTSITAHPDNPRKDLGDLSELAQSIKANGVLQNLTVVRCLGESGQALQGWYRCIIGHRRLAAAKMAGLAEVPCVIAHMTQGTQLKTMIMENMQRADLTLIEQAEAFQMMIDMGDAVSDISKETGFSDTTVRRRLKLIEFDRKQLKIAISNGATLMDFAKLDVLEDPQDKNSLLDLIGTGNFNYYLKRAQEKQIAKANMPRWIEVLNGFATPIDEVDYHTYCYIDTLHIYSDPDAFEVPENMQAEYVYTLDKVHLIASIRRKITAEDAHKSDKETKLKELQEKAEAELEENSKRCFELRLAFVKNKNISLADKCILLNYLLRLIADRELRRGYEFPNSDTLKRLLSLPAKAKPEALRDTTLGLIDGEQSSTALLYLAYALSGDEKTNQFYRRRYGQFPAHKANKPLEALYELLEEIGYQISDEEISLMSGRHPMMNLDKKYEENEA